MIYARTVTTPVRSSVATPRSEVRRKALHQLDPQQTEQRKALHTLANDSDSTIQLAALLALDDLNGLLVAYEQHSQDEAWFNAVCQRLTGLRAM